MNRTQIADRMVERLTSDADALRRQWNTPNCIRTFQLDDLLPEDLARRIFAAYPAKEKMMLKKSLREYKYVTAQMNEHDPLLEETVFAFQDPRVVELLSGITGILPLLPDGNLYAGGVSLMEQGHFLNPHLDNSHDGERKNYRLLNLLYYVSPGWEEGWGGHLELWDEGLGREARTLTCRFNRLVAMHTDRRSLHSVSPITHAAPRCCVSNYYFSPHPIQGAEYFHSTSFRGRPGQRVRDLVMRADNALRTAFLRLFPGAHWNTQAYRQK